ncbi:hypothetical protein E3J84_01685 [Candidatus Aerophobetes bacterium]|uniref:Periplasmic chaperone PpiD n=1 Tax=Aerophobetes bacterium TaxID=2030807 RepID=A0A523S308_UNCAE|nr:MAG: hypothetical protein E3J84_01685 [Candidatus Aerophobetes bacterium]
MLLQNLRKSIKPGMWIIVIAFIASLFFMYGRGERGQKPLAEVNGVAISYQKFAQSYQDVYENYRQIYEEEPSPQLEEYLRYYVLSELMENELLWQEAKKAKIKVSEEELNDVIKKIMEPFGSQEAFMRYLDSRHISYSDFKEDIKRGMTINELIQRVKESIRVTDEEIKDYWIMENEEVGVSYIFLEPDKYKKEVKTTPEEIEKYYEEHKENFTIPEKVKVDYILIKSEEFLDKIGEPIKETLEAYYQEHLAYFRVSEKRKASHILIELISSASEEEKKAKEKIEEIEKKLKEGADFATLAKEYSEDSFSAEEGGDLGFFAYSEVVPSFAEALFSLKEQGEVSEIVKTPFGYHLIKLTEIEEAHILLFEEVKEQVRQMWVKEESENLAGKEIENIRKEIEEKKVTVSEYIESHPQRGKTTPFFAQGEEIEGLGWVSQFSETAFSLAQGEISSPLRILEGYCLINLKEKKPSYIPPLKEVTEETKEKLIEEKTMKIAEEKASQVEKEAKKGKNLSLLAKELDLEYKSIEPFKRTDSIEGISSQDREKFVQTTFSLKKEEISKPLNLTNGYYIIKLTQRELLLEDFFKEKEKFKETLLFQKRTKTLNLWLQKLKEKAKIVDNSSLYIP